MTIRSDAHSAEAGYAALVAEQKYEDGLPPESRGAAHQKATASALRFAQTFPEHPESPVVLTRAAQDLYAAGDQTLAAQSAQALLARTPSVDAAKQRIAWTIIGQVSFNQGEFAQAENAFTHALAVAAAKDPERRRYHRAAGRGDLQAGRSQAQCRRPGGRGRGLPAGGARGAWLEGDCDLAIRCRGRADQRRAVESRDRGARGLSARLSQGRVQRRCRSQARGGLCRGRPRRTRGRRIRAHRRRFA